MNKIKQAIKYIYFELLLIRILIKTFLGRLFHKRIVYIVGAPIHGNLGDQAIFLAEEEFIKQYVTNVWTITLPLISNDWIERTVKNVSAIAKIEDVLLCHGGGNMGTEYVKEEFLRRKVIQAFPLNKIVIFPQTIDFSKGDEGSVEFNKTKEIYRQHKNLTIIAREQTSYDIALGAFPENKVLLTPDIVLSVKRNYVDKPRRSSALFCIRADVESVLSNSMKDEIYNDLKKSFDEVNITDTVIPNAVLSRKSRDQRLKHKLSEFRGVKLVVTDRLHGMVFAAITGTPCIAFSNYNYKVGGTYAWIKNLSYIKFCQSYDEYLGARSSLNLDSSYLYSPSSLEPYWQMIAKEFDSERS